jgi:DNA-binding CsgD family transcriptional regulator
VPNPGPNRAPPRHRVGVRSLQTDPHHRSEPAGDPGQLPGRAVERARLDRLLADGAVGRPSALRLLGEPGVGKTALIDYASSQATGYRALRVHGVAAEHEMPYAGLHLLCAPLLDEIHVLDAFQRDVLTCAVGSTAGATPDCFHVSLATLHLLTRLAATQPVCCIVDDAHWLDRATARVLAFVARRVRCDALVILLAERTQNQLSELDGVPEMRLGPLPSADARSLLASTAPAAIDPVVIERILIETRGIPRELVDAFDGTSAAEVAGGYAIPAPRRALRDVHHDGLRAAEQLPANPRRLLLAAAAEPTGDATVARRAAVGLNIAASAAEDLEARGLLTFGPRILFTCPALRSAVYAAAPHAERRAIHRALADAFDAEADSDRRTWHLALATSGLDDGLADELERVAPRARARGGLAAYAAFVEKAALLTADPARRAQRALVAAAAKHDVGAPDEAERLLALAESTPTDDARMARAALERARIAFAARRDKAGPRLLFDAARRIDRYAPAEAREAYLEALMAATFAVHSDTTTPALADVAWAAWAAATDGPAQPTDLLLEGLTIRVLDSYALAVVPLTRALTQFQDAELDSATAGWLWLATCVAADLWDAPAWAALSSRLTHGASSSAATMAAHACAHRVVFDVYRGQFDAARAGLREAATRGANAAPLTYPALLLAAWQGREEMLRHPLPSARRDARDRGDAMTLAAADLATAVLHNSLGQYDQAVTAAQEAAEFTGLAVSGWALVELVEAAARSGAHDTAARAVSRLGERTEAAGTDWALGVQALARALVTDDRGAESLYEEAIDRLARAGIRIHLGRAQLLYGEWLRRQDRRLDARVPLAAARELFAAIGARAFADRAHRELLATGERARKRTVDTERQLTPQEIRIAYLARDGLTNPEIGGRLIVSPRTVEYHLHKVFGKLGITSRTELHLVLTGVAEADRAQPDVRAARPGAVNTRDPGVRLGIRRSRAGWPR